MIQSVYFSSTQVTIHPFSISKKVNDQLETKSFVIISECTKHNKNAVTLFQKKLIQFIREQYNNTITDIYYASDGAASQYKNKYNFSNLAHHYEDYGIEAEWHFYASCHGKSACDGIGGRVKRLVRQASARDE